MLCMTLCLLFSAVYSEEPAGLPQSLYEIPLKTINGQSVSMSAFRGRVLLVVNVASGDKNASQMEQLEELYQKFVEQGFLILAFPSNNFLNGEPGTNEEIRAKYQEKYHFTFPLFEKVQVTGPNKSPLYVYLTNNRTDPTFGWEIEWNFTKFLIDRHGHVVNRFSTTTSPTDQRVIDAVQKALAAQ